MHDTPPPTRLGDGSFNAELKDELTFHPVGGGRFHHRCVPADATAPYLAEVRVLRGNGNSIHHDEAAAGSVITIELKNDDDSDAGNLVITGGADFFQIDSDQRLKDPTPGNKGRRKYEHPGRGRSFHINRIVVEKPAGNIELDETKGDHEEEYVVMIWHAEDVHREIP